MQKKCKICIKNHEIIVVLRQTKTAELIWKVFHLIVGLIHKVY